MFSKYRFVRQGKKWRIQYRSNVFVWKPFKNGSGRIAEYSSLGDAKVELAEHIKIVGCTKPDEIVYFEDSNAK